MRACVCGVHDTCGHAQGRNLRLVVSRKLTPPTPLPRPRQVYVFDVTRRDSLQHLREKWMEDYKSYSTVEGAVQMVVGNKVDLGEGAREVSPEEGAAFAREHGCLYKETSAKTDTGGVDAGVYDALVWGMVCTILDNRPALLTEGGGAGGVQLERRGARRRQGGAALPCC
ncbi:MAG: P-loop containing nucleoside triphosphate hydrolase protein [Monoraphidium minutum]|nr:MAG: P-loop containing nucleoside triphosphate hydrolase protein [Monoraphidium minutum]